MATKYVVDTHALVWFLEGNSRLGPLARDVLEERTSRLVVPIIALSEACWMIEHGKTSIPTSDAFLQTVETDPRVTIIPFDRMVLQRTLPLKEITEMHDRHIVATALLLRDQGETVAILTKDANIHSSGLVSTVW